MGQEAVEILNGPLDSALTTRRKGVSGVVLSGLAYQSGGSSCVHILMIALTISFP